MPYRGRKAVSIENAHLRVTVVEEGGHIAELAHVPSGVNPLWSPPWDTIEPSTYDPVRHPEYGGNAESRLLSGILGHNLCLDVFGGPSEAEAAAGLGVHGEASVLPYTLKREGTTLTARLTLPTAQLRLARVLALAPDAPVVQITETVENLLALDRPIAWTQHATLGPPFLERGKTQLRCPGTKGLVFPADFAGPAGRMQPGAEFSWPHAPKKVGGTLDLRTYTEAEQSGGFVAVLMDPHREQAFVAAWSPTHQLTCGYAWRRADFPWLGLWEENHGRTAPPWKGRTMTLGLEFGASPLPETRRQMIERGTLFGVPAYRWLPARAEATVTYCAFVMPGKKVPEDVQWDQRGAVTLA